MRRPSRRGAVNHRCVIDTSEEGLAALAASGHVTPAEASAIREVAEALRSIPSPTSDEEVSK